MDKDCCSFLFHLSNSFSSLCPPVSGMEKFLENFLCLSRIAKKNSEKEETILDMSKIMIMGLATSIVDRHKRDNNSLLSKILYVNLT